MSLSRSTRMWHLLLLLACSLRSTAGRRIHVQYANPRPLMDAMSFSRVRAIPVLADVEDATAMPRSFFRRASLSALSSIVPLVSGEKASAKSRDDVSYEIRKTNREWRKALTDYQYFVLREGGTEPPRTSPLVKEKRDGVFYCAACDNLLFNSADKFESGTGWPSFARTASSAAVEEADVFAPVALVMGKECRCARCGGHLGDLFNDGFLFQGTEAAKTGRRYCIDGTALSFEPRGESVRISGESIIEPLELPSWLEPPEIKRPT